ncbi:hypothetical protein HY990_01765 [Candidatus Micrarchaeota archaeon]|nr:hypothetical protein [Candidatus Micrarchaeota archaeon]
MKNKTSKKVVLPSLNNSKFDLSPLEYIERKRAELLPPSFSAPTSARVLLPQLLDSSLGNSQIVELFSLEMKKSLPSLDPRSASGLTAVSKAPDKPAPTLLISAPYFERYSALRKKSVKSSK